ncbi:hypothetical protein [Microbacterium sp. MM2322]|uniref:hypothetical protein n=1 Tax=Microbacterium sp. MM2322 TaxID=3157631 RepID=UPI0032D58906
MARRSTVRRGLPSVVVAILVVALTVAVGALVVLALQRAQGDSVPSGAQSAPPVASTPPSPSPSASAVALTPPGAAERFLAVGADMIWRATAGVCGGDPPVLERSDDGGDTWADVTPTYRGIAQIRDLLPFADTEADLVADVGDDCETQALRTFTQGTFWSPYDDLLAQSTYLDGASVIVDGTALDAPCAQPWGLRASGDTAAFICDGTAYATTDGRTSPIGTGVRALDVLDGTVVGATTAPDCDGIQLAVLSPDPEPLACVEGDAAAPLALSLTADTITVWAGDELVRTAR